jgi:hypothetical protein
MRDAAKKPLSIALLITLGVTIAARVVPAEHGSLVVAGVFCGAVYWLVWRHDTECIRSHGLSLGGLFEPEALSAARVSRSALRAAGLALLVAAVFFPPFVIGYIAWWDPQTDFALKWGDAPLDEALGQVLAIALPEEVFYRGYLQSALDRAWPPRMRVLGADVGMGLVLSSAIFAIGHVATEPHIARLSVFFPSLIFGYLRARSGGVGAPTLFHAACNLLAAYLGRGYGLIAA